MCEVLTDQVCVLCGDQIQGHGNNPSPVAEIGECCNQCNGEKVLPARLQILLQEHPRSTRQPS